MTTPSDPNHSSNTGSNSGRPDPARFVTGGIEGVFSGLSNLLRSLGELAEKGQELKKSGQFTTESGKDVSFHYGLNVRTMNGGRDLKVEPFGTVQPAATAKPQSKSSPTAAVTEVREPLVDVFEEEQHALVIAEMPGIDREHLSVNVEGDILLIEATSPTKKYRKELLLPFVPNAAGIAITCNNGVVEIRLPRA
jgi:HSP20 family protein